MNTDSLSLRGRNLASNPARVDMEMYFNAVQNKYEPVTNPEGAFPLNMAENTLMADHIKSELENITSENTMPDWVLKYTDGTGHPEVRKVMAHFLAKYLCKCPIDPDTIGFSAGASAIIETGAFLLAEKGDVVVIPAPSYPMYTNDMGVKSGLERFDLQTHFNIEEVGSKAPLCIDQLEEVKKQLEKAEKRFRILLITSPDNPTGCMYAADQLKKMADWCIKNNIHMVVNEIYAFSQIDTENKIISADYKETVVFSSFANIMEALQSDYLHLWYALSKDFAMSGMRFGIVHSLNKPFMTAFGNVNIPHMVSNYTQWMIGELFKRESFLENYISENKKRVTGSYIEVIKTFKKLGIPYVPSRGSLFLWADFSRYLTEKTDKGQTDLWMAIYKNTGILLTPGDGFGHHKKGLFRVVHTGIPTDHLTVAMKKLEAYLLTI